MNEGLVAALAAALVEDWLRSVSPKDPKGKPSRKLIQVNLADGNGSPIAGFQVQLALREPCMHVSEADLKKTTAAGALKVTIATASLPTDRIDFRLVHEPR